MKGRSRIAIAGDDLAITGKSITPVALLLHEFATNAAKYGSLSNETGRVDIVFAFDGEKVEILWRETGGPPPPADSETGFGSRLVEASAIQLGGRVEREWSDDGLVIRLEMSRPLLEAGADAPQ